MMKVTDYYSLYWNMRQQHMHRQEAIVTYSARISRVQLFRTINIFANIYDSQTSSATASVIYLNFTVLKQPLCKK